MSKDLINQKFKTIPLFWRNENIYINCSWNKIKDYSYRPVKTFERNKYLKKL